MKSKDNMKDTVDPLYTIFEQHLYNFEDDQADRKTFIATVLKDYLTYLRKLNIVIPKSLENSVVEELAFQVNAMLIKKIYGCLTLDDHRKRVPETVKKRAKKRYGRLSKSAPRKTAI